MSMWQQIMGVTLLILNFACAVYSLFANDVERIAKFGVLLTFGNAIFLTVILL